MSLNLMQPANAKNIRQFKETLTELELFNKVVHQVILLRLPRVHREYVSNRGKIFRRALRT